MIKRLNNRIEYYNDEDLLHREDGPARIWDDGSKVWFINGQKHRVDGPAIEWSDGEEAWFQHNVLHRVDGPARSWANGDKEYWINNQYLTEEEFKLYTFVNKL